MEAYYSIPTELSRQQVFTIMNNFATALSGQARHEQAVEIHRQVLEIRMEVLRDEHSSTLMAIQNLAETLRQQGKPEEANTYLADPPQHSEMSEPSSTTQILLCSSRFCFYCPVVSSSTNSLYSGCHICALIHSSSSPSASIGTSFAPRRLSLAACCMTPLAIFTLTSRAASTPGHYAFNGSFCLTAAASPASCATAATSISSVSFFTRPRTQPCPMPGKQTLLLHSPTSYSLPLYSTGGNGEPVAMKALQSVHLTRSFGCAS